MQKHLTCLLTFILITFSTAGYSAAENYAGEMLMTGSWHGNEVTAENGQTWLALVKGEDKYHLQHVSLTIELVVDEVLDTSPAKTGKKVSTSANGEPVVMLRNLPQLSPGQVQTAEIVDQDFNAGKPTGIYFNGIMYELEISCSEETYEQEQADCPLLLRGGGAEQALMSYPVYRPGTDQQGIASEAFPQVLWAGDLDGDDRLDLIIDLTNHYNVAKPTLLLSGAKAEEEMVKPVAAFRTTGC